MAMRSIRKKLPQPSYDVLSWQGQDKDETGYLARLSEALHKGGIEIGGLTAEVQDEMVMTRVFGMGNSQCVKLTQKYLKRRSCSKLEVHPAGKANLTAADIRMRAMGRDPSRYDAFIVVELPYTATAPSDVLMLHVIKDFANIELFVEESTEIYKAHGVRLTAAANLLPVRVVETPDGSYEVPATTIDQLRGAVAQACEHIGYNWMKIAGAAWKASIEREGRYALTEIPVFHHVENTRLLGEAP